MLEHPQESWVNGRARFMIKFFFFRHLDTYERVKLMENRLSMCHLRLETLESENTSSFDPYESAVWQRSLVVLCSEMQWLREQLAKEAKALYNSHEATAQVVGWQ
jgi:hypothetical protein